MQVAEVRSRVTPILMRRAVRRAGVFGSVARGETAHDVDLLVEMPRPFGLFSFLTLKQELENALGTKVDLVEYSALKPALRDRILHDEVTIL